MKLFKATPKDSDKLSEYFKGAVLPGPVHICTHRKDFFSPYRLQSDDFSTYYLADPKGTPQAVATLIFKKGWVEGEEQVIGYATDLRVSHDREAILQWAQHFLSIIKLEKEKRNCPSIFSVVPQAHRQTYNAFIRPRYNKKQLPRYYLFRRMGIVTIHGLFPFAPKPLESLVIRWATPEDHLPVTRYIAEKKANKPISFAQSHLDVTRSLEQWEGLDMKDFMIALDSNGEVVGCTAPWRFTNHTIYAKAYSPKEKQSKPCRTIYPIWE